MGLALALYGSFSAASDDTASGKTAPSDSAQDRKPEPAKPPTNPEVAKPPLFKFGEDDRLAIEYWTFRNPNTDVARIAGGQISPCQKNLVLQADPNTTFFDGVLVTVEFTFDETSKLYVLGGPIKIQSGKSEITVEALAQLVGRLLSDINAALRPHFDPTKPLPLKGTANVRVTPFRIVKAADPFSKNRDPVLEKLQYVELTLKVSTKRKLGPDEKQP